MKSSSNRTESLLKTTTHYMDTLLFSKRLMITGLTALTSSGYTAGASTELMEELLVKATYDSRTIDVSEARIISPDTAALLTRAPGANVNGNGPLTGIPQYRGMYGARIATSMDGRALAPAGPNWMDPPLSYAAAGQLESLELYRGIVPVSVAQESIGGAIEVHTFRGDYGNNEQFQLSGKLVGSAQSVNQGSHLNAALYSSNKNHRLKVGVMSESGDDTEFPGGKITPSEYERQRYDFGYGFRNGVHSLQLDYSYNDTDDTGTAALPMDIGYITGTLTSLDYSFAPPSHFSMKASLYGSELKHGMTNYHLRTAPTPTIWRQNIGDSENLGFKLSTTFTDDDGSWTAGIDGFSEQHNSDIDNPNNAMFYVVNFNRAEREVLGMFIERKQDWSVLSGNFGLRYNHVAMDASEVDASSAMMMPSAKMLRDNFNNTGRSQTDHNIDLIAKLDYSISNSTSFYAGIAQKNRSPSYQERYLWLPLQSTAGLADGYAYTGNITLKPEVSRQLETGLDFNNGTFTLAPRIFFSRVDNYIQGTPSKVAPAVMLVRMMNIANGTNNPDPLQFNNVDAELYGFDMDWRWKLADRLTLSGIVNYVRGKRRDVSDNLYRIAPPNTSVRLDYTANHWATGIEAVLYGEQNEVSKTNGEQETSNYALVNISASWQATSKLHLAAGVDNVFDEKYDRHLGGYNRAANPDISKGNRLSGTGSNLFVRAEWSF